jgi:DNA-binding CsgD family transcriptional regulator
LEIGQKDVFYYLGEPKNFRKVFQHNSKMMKKAELEPEELTCFMLFYVAGLSTQNICESLEIDTKTARKLIKDVTRKISIQYLANY